MMHRIGLLVLVIVASSLHAQPDPYENQVARASDDWKRTIKRMKLPEGVQADLWAAEPHVANIVAFHFDEKGRCYVAETFRLHHGVTDNRSHPKSWTDDDLACRTVSDRVAMYKKHLKGKFASYEKDHDRVRLVEDTKGTGRADKATILMDGFKNAADGLGSGVLARNGKVWYTCIPDLWLLQDTKGTGRADVKKSLHTGYGVHTAFLGHDMHGLRMGPDGKLYFSIGDRGLHVETGGKTISSPDTGAVLRCNPDGSELELFATGLRNPQELAFDEFGNLFTGDNNADGGDQARWVHVVEGGDTGWRMSYQYMPGLGPWNAEKLWHTQETNTGAYVVPPITHIANGPSGLTYHPGTSLLPKKYDKHFFLCDFRGGGAGSGIHAFQLKPKGASFELVNRQQFAWSVLAVDCDFAPDGGFYVSDWIDGWGQPNKGRIYKLFDPKKLDDPTVKEVKKLLAEGFNKKTDNELAGLLGHKDQRIRQEAQFELVDRGRYSVLGFILTTEKNKFARLHALWGLGQLARENNARGLLIIPSAKDDDPDVRAQAVKVMGDSKLGALRDHVLKRLTDSDARVRFEAAIALGKIGNSESIPAVLTMLKDNNDADPYLRHAGVMALAGIGDRDALHKLVDDPSLSIRLATLLAMRRLKMPEIADFLRDKERQIILEAARAIYDVPIPGAMDTLAIQEMKNLSGIPDRAILRMLAANYRLGGKEHAQALVAAATRSDISFAMRDQALKMLQAWESPSGRDWVVGMWRPITKRSPEGIEAVNNGVKKIFPTMRATVLDAKHSASARIDALLALESFKDGQLDQVAKDALKSDEPRLRHQARRIALKKASPKDAVATLADVVDTGAVVERQGAFAMLGAIRNTESDDVIERWLGLMLQKKVPAEVHLDILSAAQKSKRPSIAKKLAAYEATRDAKDPMSVHRESLVGGDAEAGRKIFFDKTEVSCLRCHKINGVGGEVGPDLTGIGKKQKRDYLLEAIVDPNKQIAKGFESLLITLQNGKQVTGILKSEDAKEVRLMTAEGRLITIRKADIDERTRGPSAMPADLAPKLTRSELRDLVEYLAGLE